MGREPGTTRPLIIQGGMGVAVSCWQLARKVSQRGHLGVVSGTALDAVVARRLQDGDVGGHMRRALAAFPVPEMAARVLDRYFRPEGRPPGTSYAPIPRLALRQNRASQELSVVSNFAEVWLAKEGHDGLVGINFLEKIQMATPAAAFGAILADVDYVLMGAGIPARIPKLLNQLAAQQETRLKVDVPGAAREDVHEVVIDPIELMGCELPPLKRPVFLAIISAHILAEYLAKDEVTRPDGFVVEGPRAGGHNAPPRGKMVIDELGQPVYGPRDDADLTKVAAVGLPFWVAGAYGAPDKLQEALDTGACGVQVGTVFALSVDSGITGPLHDRLIASLTDDTLKVRTAAIASPTGFPFKVANMSGTMSEPEVYRERPRLCDLGYLRTPYIREGGAIGYRCPAEPEHMYIKKGGTAEEAANRSCLCNALTATVGLGQTRPDGYSEAPLITMGEDLSGAKALLAMHPQGWTADDVIDWLMSGIADDATAVASDRDQAATAAATAELMSPVH